MRGHISISIIARLDTRAEQARRAPWHRNSQSECSHIQLAHTHACTLSRETFGRLIGRKGSSRLRVCVCGCACVLQGLHLFSCTLSHVDLGRHERHTINQTPRYSGPIRVRDLDRCANVSFFSHLCSPLCRPCILLGFLFLTVLLMSPFNSRTCKY